MSLNTEKLCWYGRHGSFSKICACPENVRQSVKTLVTVRRQSLPRVGRSNYSAAFSHSCVLLRQQGLLELYGRPEKTVVSARNATSLNPSAFVISASAVILGGIRQSHRSPANDSSRGRSCACPHRSRSIAE